MWRPATPARWYSATVRCTLRALPKPVSASATSGMSSTAVMRAACPAISVIVVKPRSGKPMSAIDTPAPVMYAPRNPLRRTSDADRASYTPGSTSTSGSASMRRSAARGVSSPGTADLHVAAALEPGEQPSVGDDGDELGGQGRAGQRGARAAVGDRARRQLEGHDVGLGDGGDDARALGGGHTAVDAVTEEEAVERLGDDGGDAEVGHE